VGKSVKNAVHVQIFCSSLKKNSRSKNLSNLIALFHSIMRATERSKTERGSEGPGLALSAGEHTVVLLERRMWVSYVTVAVSWQDI
jgi:hypothetical protein